MAIFDIPFARNGDKNLNIPEQAQTDGSISLEEGWTSEYSKNPALGGKFIQRADMNGLLYKTQMGVNILENRVNALLGVSVVSALSAVIGVGEIGKQIYCTANDNMYLLIDNSQLLESSTLQDAIDLNAVKNITQQEILFKNVVFGSNIRSNFTANMLSNKYTNNTNQTQFIAIRSASSSSSVAIVFDMAASQFSWDLVMISSAYYSGAIVPIAPNQEFKVYYDGQGANMVSIKSTWDFWS